MALLNVVSTQVVLDIVMFISETRKTTAVHVMPLAMREMTAVQMLSNFASVRAIVYIYYYRYIYNSYSIPLHGWNKGFYQSVCYTTYYVCRTYKWGISNECKHWEYF